jgi:hypothetical protein
VAIGERSGLILRQGRFDPEGKVCCVSFEVEKREKEKRKKKKMWRERERERTTGERRRTRGEVEDIAEIERIFLLNKAMGSE